jgi:hypothetical protein
MPRYTIRLINGFYNVHGRRVYIRRFRTEAEAVAFCAALNN